MLTICMVMTGCSNTNATAEGADISTALSGQDIFSDRDFQTDYDENRCAYIELSGDSAACSSNAVQISGSTITIIDEGTYVLSGTLNDGMIIVHSEKTDKTQLVLNGVTIHSETSAPIYIAQSDKVFITIAAGSVNTLSNGGTFTPIDDSSIDAVVFSKEDVTLNGSGALIITSPVGHGIVSKDSLRITGGSYDINCASHALAGKDDVCIADGDFTIVSGKDGIHAENADDAEAGYIHILNGVYSITAEGDGISASAYVQIEDGSFDITTGGGSTNAMQESSASWGNFMGGGKHRGGGSPGRNSMPSATDTSSDSASLKGIKAETSLMISGGSFTINSADDSVHSNANVTINGGTFEIASGDDAFHAEDTLTVASGTIHISESYEGLEGLHIVVSGGDIDITASDDGLNAAGGTDASGMTGGRDGRFGHGGMGGNSNGSILISGGNISVTAYGDGIDANGTIDMTGGYVVVCGPSRGDTATLDYDSRATISGGTFIGTGASGMAQTFSTAEQGVVAVNAGSQSADSEIVLKDADGKEIIRYSPGLEYSVVILSSPDIVSGDTYSLVVGSASGEITAQ